MSIVYFDTSAILKLTRVEPGSVGLRAWLDASNRDDSVWVSSALVLTEVPRALRRILPASPLPNFSPVIDRFALRNVDEEILVRAGALTDPTLRSLDAIHLATALDVAATAGDELEALITYDRRLAALAQADGLRVLAPG